MVCPATETLLSSIHKTGPRTKAVAALPFHANERFIKRMKPPTFPTPEFLLSLKNNRLLPSKHSGSNSPQETIEFPQLQYRYFDRLANNFSSRKEGDYMHPHIFAVGPVPLSDLFSPHIS
jgi:hypothetical protein